MCNIGVRGLDLARASARSTGKVLAALVIAMCALMVGAHDAYAITVRDDGNGYKRAIVYPHDYPDGRYAALAEFLGYDWDSFSQQTRTAIIEDDGKFMELYRARCKNYRYENENLQDGSGSVIGAITTKLAEVVDSVSGTVFGNDKTWYCSCTDSDYDAARENVEYWLYPREGQYTSTITGKNVRLTYNGAGNKWAGDYIDATLSDELITKIEEENTDGFVIAVSKFSGNYYANVYFSNAKVSITVNNGINIQNISGESASYKIIYGIVNSMNVNQHKTTITYSDINRNVSTNANQNTTNTNFQYSNSGNITQEDPYNPTPDPTPTAPVIQIGDVTVDLSNGPYTVNNVTYTAVLDNENNWTVQITNNTTNNYGGDVQAADPTDYTSILNAILAAINSLRSEMTTYTNQINSNITTAINSLNTSIKNVETTIKNKLDAFKQQMHQDIQTLQTNLQNNFNGKFDAYTTQLWSNMAALDGDLLEAIHNAAVYVVDGLYWDGGMDDGEVVKWLKMIYSRLKDKKVTVPSVDEDPEDWLDALKRILDELLNVILSGLNVATLATAFEGLKARFPISIPWDIAAIVNMFAGGAVTPVFDLPLPNGTNGSYTTVHVDLHEWDDEMALVRQGELLLFGIALMYNTKWMFDTITTTFRRGD